MCAGAKISTVHSKLLMLHAVGIATGLIAGRLPVRFAARTTGGAIAALGLVLLVTL